MTTPRRWPGQAVFDDLPIQAKASLALGANAYLTSKRSAAGLHVLSTELVPKVQAFAEVGEAVVSTHMKIFRYVSWASNGIGEKLLKPLEDVINAELDAACEHIAVLTRRPDLSEAERAALKDLVEKWQSCKAQAKDTLDVGRTDAAMATMATMMIGQTDDSFEAVDAGLREMSQALIAHATTLQSQLASDAQRNQQVVLWVTALGMLISVALAIGRSIVRPIRSITQVMQRLSAGETQAEIALGTRRDEIGQMAAAIDVFRKNIIDKVKVERTLAEAIEAITEGFSLYDAEDRLVVCNSHYRAMFSYGPDTVTPGTSFEQIIAAAAGRVLIDGAGDSQSWMAERLARHRNPTGPHVQHAADPPGGPAGRRHLRRGRNGQLGQAHDLGDGAHARPGAGAGRGAFPRDGGRTRRAQQGRDADGLGAQLVHVVQRRPQAPHASGVAMPGRTALKVGTTVPTRFRSGWPPAAPAWPSRTPHRCRAHLAPPPGAAAPPTGAACRRRSGRSEPPASRHAAGRPSG